MTTTAPSDASASSQDTIDVVVHAQRLASERSLLIELRAGHGGLLPSADPGAHVDVHLGSLIRQYSLIDVSDPTRYLVCVQHEPTGRGGSKLVHQRLRVGDRLRISHPRNNFGLHDGPHHAVLVAGGIGITPLLPMAETLEASGTSYELHCYSRGPMPLREHIEQRAYAHRIVHHDTLIDDSLRAGPPKWTVRDDTIVYACGPSGFLEAITAYAAAAGLAPEALRTERFGVSEPVDVTGGSFTVVAASTGQRMPVAQDQTIAHVLESHGYDVALSCEQGFCGACLVGVIEGVPDHRDEIQSDAEHAANTRINVCVSRSCTPELTLDI
ncbi:PDR/VanB family oxidoreductase [Nocardioides alcanivorans]|uniref:PDR/VanB family oxidoreductase n=1 Tax=Nocardioides alcanivorans TaxID=2897352 RepID=UPI001F3DE1A0|nr:PDR/VanB family oxidoreductase [Nocardioides alcanivorans]